MPDKMLDGLPENVVKHMLEDMPEHLPDMLEHLLDMPEHLPDRLEHLLEDMLGKIPDDMFNKIPDRILKNMLN